MKNFKNIFFKIKNSLVKNKTGNKKQSVSNPIDDDLLEGSITGNKKQSVSNPIDDDLLEESITGDEPETVYSQTGATKIVDEEDTLVMEGKSVEESPASLLLLNGPKDLIGLSWPLANIVTSVGRSRRLNDVIISHNSLSKTHFQIIKESGKFYLVDLKSTNKTYIDDNEIEPYKKTALKNNSYIRASYLIFKFLDKGNIESFSSMKILKKAQTDSLTGAGNRQLLKIKGPEYFFSNHKLSLIVFDIDNFKVINDSFGHTAGDYVLKTFSKYVLEIVREGDLFIRYGGDEFCIFTPSSLSVAKSISFRIKRKLQTNKFIFKDRRILLDISIGIAEKSSADKTWEDIYHRADKLSYQQKRRKKTAQGSRNV